MSAARVALAAWAALVWPALAAAQASFTTQQRTVEASSHSDLWLWAQGTNPGPPAFDPPTASYGANHSDADSAPDFNNFSASASSTAPPAVGPAAPAASASASHTSSLSPTQITASGGFTAQGDSDLASQPMLDALNALLHPPIPYFVGMLGGSEQGRSHFEVDFQVAAPTAYQLAGSLTLSPGNIGGGGLPYVAAGSGRIELIGPSGSVALLDQPVGCGCTTPLDSNGVLAPGSYTLLANVEGGTNAHCDLLGCNDPSMSGSFTLSLALPASVVPGPTLPLASLLAVALAATGAVALRRA